MKISFHTNDSPCRWGNKCLRYRSFYCRAIWAGPVFILIRKGQNR